MSNNLYHWHDEVMVKLEMQELYREIEQIRLINDAGLSAPGLFERLVIALGSKLVEMGQRMREQYTAPRQYYQSTSSKLST